MSEQERAAEVAQAAEEDGVVVGFAHLTFPDGFAHLEQLDVLATHHRRGIGSALVRAAMEEARWTGHDRLSLCTYRDLPWNGPFYARLGFRELERLEHWHRAARRTEERMGLLEHGERLIMVTSLTK